MYCKMICGRERERESERGKKTRPIEKRKFKVTRQTESERKKFCPE